MTSEPSTLEAVRCPSCGGSLPRHARWITSVCPFCGNTVSNGDRTVKAAAFLASRALHVDPLDSRPRATLDGHPYRVLGRLGRGEHGDVLWAERARRLTERVVLHVPHGDPGPSERAWTALVGLQRSDAPGAPHFTLRLPLPVTREGGVCVYRYASGYVHTLLDVRRAYPGGVDGRHAVWMWRRLLELLGFIHRSGPVHGGVRPEHVLVHARDHGARLVGWSRADTDGRPDDDVAAAARVVLGVSAPALPPGLAGLLHDVADRGTPDAWALSERVAAEARGAYGPPRYHPFTMPVSPGISS